MPEPVLSSNLAQSVKYRRWFNKKIAPLVRRVRIERNSILRPQWLRYRRMWTLRGTEQSYHGRLRLYIPTAHRILENWEQKLKADLFPQSGKWFRCTPTSTTDEDRSLEVQSMLMRCMQGHMRLKHKFPGLLRNLAITGTAPVDIGWKHEEKVVPTIQQIVKDGKKVSQDTMMKVTQYLGPTFRNVDPFLFYVYPSTVQFVDEADLVFEDQLMAYDTLERMSKTLIDSNDKDLGYQVENFSAVKDLYKARGNADHFQAEQIRLAERGLTSKVDMGKVDPSRPMDVTTVYWHGSLLDEEDEDGNADDEPDTWYKCLLVGDDCPVAIRQNPWWDQTPSYLAAKFTELANEFWGYGLMFLLDHLQYFQNDIWNQTGDALVFSLNPIVALDSTAIQYPDSIRFSPGARWLLRDPANSIYMMEPPKETPTLGMAAIQSISTYMNDVSNISPASPPMPAKNSRAAGTATGISIMSGDAMLQLREVEESVEGGVLTPMLPKLYSRFQQCLDVDLTLRLEGRDGSSMVETKVSRDDLIGSFEWEWLGSVFTFNQNVKTQHMLSFIQIVARLPPGALDQDQARIDWRYLLRTMWSTGFGEREANRVVKDIQPTRSIDPGIENELFLIGRGEEVTVSPTDDDMKHVQAHDKLLEDKKIDPDVLQLLMQHVKRHAASVIMKQEQAKQQQQQQALQQAAQTSQLLGAATGQPPGGPGANGGAGPPGQPGAGSQPPSMTGSGTVMPQAPGRLASTTTEADVQRRLPRG